MFQIPVSVDIEDGTYPAVLEAIEPTDHPTYGKGRKWSFLVEHTASQDIPDRNVKAGEKVIDSISRITSSNLGPKTVAYGFLTGLLGRALKAGEQVEDPTGTRCLVTISHNENGYPTIAAVAPFVEPQQTLPGVPR